MKNVKRINESQLRAIVAESVKKVLNEDCLNLDMFTNPGRVKNKKVADLGHHAFTNVRGTVGRNDSDWDVMVKHNGGKVNDSLPDFYFNAISGSEEGMKMFFKALKYNKDLRNEISGVLMKNAREAKQARLNRE